MRSASLVLGLLVACSVAGAADDAVAGDDPDDTAADDAAADAADDDDDDDDAADTSTTDAPRIMIGLGGGYAVSPGHARMAYALVEAAYRPAARIPIAVHGSVLAGAWKARYFDRDLGAKQPWLQARIGGEVYVCELVCGFVNVDVGYQSVSNIAIDTGPSGNDQRVPVTRRGAIVAARAGVDLGTIVYLRLAVGYARSVTGDFEERSHSVSYDWGRTLNASASLIARF